MSKIFIILSQTELMVDIKHLAFFDNGDLLFILAKYTNLIFYYYLVNHTVNQFMIHN